MVPEVDKFDTEQQLRTQRDTLEAARREILAIPLSKELTTNDSEAQAVRKLASRSAQQARQWTGRMILEITGVTPYPHSSDASNTKVDPTTVVADKTFSDSKDLHPIQRIKNVRTVLKSLDTQMEELINNCIPGSRFNMFLVEVQKQVIQASMWLGETLHFCAEPKEQPATVAPELTGFAAAEAHDLLALADLGKRVVVSHYLPGYELTGSVTKDEDKAAPGNYYVQLDEPTSNGVQRIDLTPSAVDAIHNFKIKPAAVREFMPEEAAADLAKIQADSEPGDEFKANLEAGAAIAGAVAPGNEVASTPDTTSDLSKQDTADVTSNDSGEPVAEAEVSGNDTTAGQAEQPSTPADAPGVEAEPEAKNSTEQVFLAPNGNAITKKDKKSVRK